jgi:hypothetical protein
MALAQPLVSADELQLLSLRSRPQARADERVLVVREDLAGLLPQGGLRRGTVVGVGSRSLLHALLAGPSAAGSWAALIGMPSLGLAAAAEAGVVLERTVVVGAATGPVLPEAVAALIDAVDLVVLGPQAVVTAAVCRRLEARTRERGAVLLVEGRRTWPGAADLEARVVRAGPVGLGAGHGHLHGVLAEVEVVGRGAAARPRRGEVWLQGTAEPPFAERAEGAAGAERAGSTEKIAAPEVPVLRVVQAG